MSRFGGYWGDIRLGFGLAGSLGEAQHSGLQSGLGLGLRSGLGLGFPGLVFRGLELLFTCPIHHILPLYTRVS